MTSLLVASGIGVVGVVPALAAGDSPRPAAFHSDDDRDRRTHDRWFSTRGDVRYVWFRVCDTDDTTTATTTSGIPDATTETVAPDAVAAAVEGASTETATDTDTATSTDTIVDETTTDTTPETTTADDEDEGEVYPTFVVAPLPKDEAKALRKLDDRPCYDLTTGAPATTDTTTTDTTETTTDAAATVTETPTATPPDTGGTG